MINIFFDYCMLLNTEINCQHSFCLILISSSKITGHDNWYVMSRQLMLTFSPLQICMVCPDQGIDYIILDTWG